MTVLLAAFGPSAGVPDHEITRILPETWAEAWSCREVWRDNGAMVAAARLPWEAEVDEVTGPLIHVSPDLIVLADASLYYVPDLKRKLAPHVDVSVPHTTGALIAAAIRTFGARFAAAIEGDFAVIAWDRAQRRVLLARDFCGRRSLYFATLGDGTLVVASHLLSVAAVPGAAKGYDLDVLAASAACLMAYGDRTAFAGVRSVTAATTLRWQEDGAMQTVDRWVPPAFSDGWRDGTPDEVALALRDLLERAVRERLPRSAPASVWMSGGWDSTAVFGAGRAALERLGRAGDDLLPVSVSYPPDDAGYEDPYIREVADRWKSPVTWIASDSISIIEDLERRVRVRDDPMPHHFEMMQRMLARASRALGARVALDGFGGDQLFKSSPDSVFADHLLRGRWGLLARFWGRQLDRSPRAFARHCLLPLVPTELLRWIAVVTGRTVAGPLELTPPQYMTPRESLERDMRPRDSRRPDESVNAFEARFLLDNPYVNRVLAWTHSFATDEGIRLRSPLYDPRVVTFAAGRPHSDRNDGREVKIVLRRAMRGILPDSVLAPRPKKTGVSAEYFRRQLPSLLEGYLTPMLDRPSGSMLLADLGLVDPIRLRRVLAEYVAAPDHLVGAQLFATYETEAWLAVRAGDS